MTVRTPPARGRPTADAAASMHDRILGAAWELLLETGPEGFSMNRLALVTRASKQTLYARYAGKAALLRAVMEERLAGAVSLMGSLRSDCDIHAAFADLAQRVALSNSHPEARMLDRLVDWLDAGQPGGEGGENRRIVYVNMRGLIAGHLEAAQARGQVVCGDIPRAAEFWLDCIIGHVRSVPFDSARHGEWAQAFARIFLAGIGAL